ncbi:MAG TPA: calcium-binding protein, partial [Actinomycetota bacterium]|nr:calcium-binding protein [Actinomycetota bacterium]
IMEGGPGTDDFNGGPGADTLRGLGGADFLNGGDDADCLVGGTARDDYRGGLGNDTLLARDSTRDTGSGGPDPDRGRFDAVDNVASVANRSFAGGC